MSSTWNEPLLWGHYADKHKGICLGFDVDEDQWTKVEYVDSRPTLADYGKASLGELSGADLKSLLSKKFRNWSYESEYRRFVGLGSMKPDYVDGNYFIKFSSKIELKEVILGERTSVRDDQVKAVYELFSDVIITQSRAAFSRFEVIKHVMKTKELEQLKA